MPIVVTFRKHVSPHDQITILKGLNSFAIQTFVYFTVLKLKGQLNSNLLFLEEEAAQGTLTDSGDLQGNITEGSGE